MSYDLSYLPAKFNTPQAQKMLSAIQHQEDPAMRRRQWPTGPARGSAPKAPDVGFRTSAGSDLSNLWLPKSAAPPVPGFDGKSYGASGQAPTSSLVTVVARVSLTFRPDGTWEVTRFLSGSVSGNGTTVLDSGVWLPIGQNASDYEVLFSGAVSGDGTVSNGAASYQSLSALRTISLTVQSEPIGTQFITASLPVVCNLRRIGTAASGASCGFSCSAMGYL